MNREPPKGSPPPFDPADYAPETLRELVAEAFHTFGEDAARELAYRFEVEFEDCAEIIERSRYSPH